jgi:hypothetical protein
LLQESQAAALSRKGLKQTTAYQASRAALRGKLLAKKQECLQQETPLPLAAAPEPFESHTDKMDAVSVAAASVEGGENIKGRQTGTENVGSFLDKFMAGHAWAFMHVRGSALGEKARIKQVDAAAKELAPTQGKFSTGVRKMAVKTRGFFASCFAPSVQAE